MLRIRSIHYDAFKSAKLARLSAEAERCWWRLQCICDDDGRTEDDPEVIAGMLFLKQRDIEPEHVDEWLEEMSHIGLIVRYEVAGEHFLAVEQWHKYQRPRRPQTSKLPPPPDSSVPVGTRRDKSGLVPQEWRVVEGSGVEQEGEGFGEGEIRANPVGAKAVDIATRCSATGGQ